MNPKAYSQEDINQLNTIQIQEIPTNVKVTQCRTLEELQEGMKKNIVGIKPIGYLNKVCYILQFEKSEPFIRI